MAQDLTSSCIARYYAIHSSLAITGIQSETLKMNLKYFP